ncbi:type I-G CRISPR-associated protein Csb2 [Candidatus Palauibacter sp.]|uniref:type I-G CRISPR-associated protein Csb2 n=1 Tax=Candidatus Palauibacter sp. TaxID=3101350 RepID=UPI003B58C5DC
MLDAGQFAVEVNFLAGRYVATSHNDRRLGEWPPHPARLFSAFVATWADENDPLERRALEWLERQPAPAIAASDAVPRRVLSHFVPVNDTSVFDRALRQKRPNEFYELCDQLHAELVRSAGEVTTKADRMQKKLARKKNLGDTLARVGKTPVKSAEAMLPDGRGKQERAFPSVSPDVPRVTYIWNTCPSDGVKDALDRLLARVTRLGHSSSLVSCRIVEEPPNPTHLVVVNGGGTRMRAVRAGQLTALEGLHLRHQQVRPRALPYVVARYRGAEVTEEEPIARPNTAGEWIVFEFHPASRAYLSSRAVELAAAMRREILSRAERPLPEGISGVRDDGTPTSMPHMVIVPIPHVAFEHADGRILGLAVSVPNASAETTQDAIYRSIGGWERAASRRVGISTPQLSLKFGHDHELGLRRVVGPVDLISLRSSIWRGPSRRWVSAIPIALPRHPGSLSRGSAAARREAWGRAEAAVRLACTHVGLPAPMVVKMSLSPLIRGARKVAQFPAFRQAGREGKPVRRQLVHAELLFADPVRGPLTLGAGRFVGLGLMRPLAEPSTQRGERDVTSG